jgi:CheY-like chemotaxis protein
LISNAIKFTPRGGNVQVRLERVNSQIEVSVLDSGQGIAPEFLVHVFDRFRQADSSTTRKASGLGLGLAIVKQLIELHGGSVRASSGGEGKGATFTMALPLKAVRALPNETDRPQPTARQRSVFKPISLRGLKVLIVDDEPDARDLLNRLLTDCDANVTMASSAAEAFESIRSHRPDVLVSDIGMSEMDGFELVKKIRALSPETGGKIPAVALTAFARSEDRARALLAGYSAHVAKPVDPTELVATLAAVSGRI